ncbi:MAG: site-2 protease family protein [Candidatus Altiarchaeota archaeon]
MKGAVRLFKVAGISVELHITFILFALLMLVFGGIETLLFLFLVFTIVLAHEFIHSMTAVMHGIKVPMIILTPIGGLASIDLPEDPILELEVSIVGPLFNFMLAFASLGLLLAINPAFMSLDNLSQDNISNLIQSDSLAGVLLMMVYINLTLGGFNMLPAFPMDGGRVFRSVLALWIDYEKATKIATAIGQAIFLALAFVGLLELNLLYVLIGGLLYYAGGNEARYVSLRKLMADATLAQIADERIAYVNGSLSWKEFISTVLRRGKSVYFIVDSGGMLKGVLELGGGRRINASATVGESGTTDYIVMEGDTKARDALKVLLSGRIILVASGGRLIGYLTADTLSESAAHLSLARTLG